MAHTADQADLTAANLFSFRHHVVLITGGATGLGEMAAQGFVQNGARVFIASRKEKELRATADRLNRLGPGRCEYVVADLKDKAGCDALCEKVKAKTDRLTVLMNNSGITWGAPYDDFPEAAGWDKLFALNVKSIFYMTVGLHALLTKTATKHDPSRVINIASMAGIETRDVTTPDFGGLGAPGSGTWSYGASKAAVIHLTKLQASRLMRDHVTVNAIAPGVFPSRMSAYGIDKALPVLLSIHPGGRLGRPEDFAGLVLFLSSKGAAHITANTIEIDGGSTRSCYQEPKDEDDEPSAKL